MKRPASLLILALVAAAACGKPKEPDKTEGAISGGSSAPTVSAAATPAAAPQPPATIAGKWTCRFANKKKESVSETLVFEPDGDAAKANIAGVDGAGNHYTGKAKATLTEGSWNMTFSWSNKVSPTWVRLKPSPDGAALVGRRGKFDDKTYEADYNCDKSG